MKKFLVILLISISTLIANARPYDDLKSAFSSGNVAVLSEHFDDKVNIFFNNQNNNVTTFQAKLLLENFFNTNRPRNFTVEESGKSSYDGIDYLIGKLETSSAIYRVYIMYRISKSNDYIINEIKFE